MLYILLAGGIFNAVLVPQLVRAMRNDADGGEAYTNRVMTLASLFLGARDDPAGGGRALGDAASSSTPGYDSAELAAQRESVIDFARFCLPAGLLLRDVRPGRPDPQRPRPVRADDVGADRQQRDRGRACSWSTWSSSGRPPSAERTGAFTTGQEALLGLGSTLGIVAQFLILLPYLRAAGFRYRPRFDFRDTGLGHTLRLGVWTVLFVIVNQIAYTVVVRLASERHRRRGRPAPTAPATRSTPTLPDRDGAALGHHRLAGDRDPAPAQRARRRADCRRPGPHPRDVAMRSALAVVIPFALLLPVIAARPLPRDLGLGRRPGRLRAVRPDARPVRRRAWSSSPSTT